MATVNSTLVEAVKEILAVDLQQIRIWNKTVPLTVEAFVHHLVEKQVRNRPDDQAVCSREGLLNYRDLDAYAIVFASRLIHHGIKQGDLIPVFFEKSMWTVVAMLALLKAGAAFVPIPCAPVQRFQTILSQIRPTVILTSVQQANTLVDMAKQVIVMGKEFGDKVEVVKIESLGLGTMPAFDPGAQIEHSQLCTQLKAWGDTAGFDSTFRMFQFSAHVFDAVIDPVFLPMTYGGYSVYPLR